MTYTKAITELAAAIGYAIDASRGNPYSERAADARDKAEKILFHVVQSAPFDHDPIIVKHSDVKPVRIDTNEKIIKPR